MQRYINSMGWLGTRRHYWMTVRLVKTAVGSQTPLLASEPITLATTMSADEQEEGWPYLRSYLRPSNDLPRVTHDWEQLGGVVVGVIERADSPPPPPPSGIPTPRQATDAGQVTGAGVPN
jgi:hypothetical protein